jgi:glutamine---fructose-6-phosphate transaminase (isomerizing)
LIMARLGRLVTSLPMSLVTLYCSKIVCDGLVSFAFSQSGQSPDLITPTEYFTKEGALTTAFVNDVESPLARSATFVFPLHAGKEESVAATKSFIAELACGAHLVSAWQGDVTLRDALMRLPDALVKAVNAGEKDWSRSKVIDVLAKADRLFVIGRGTGLPIAMEAALKLKETCAIQAEAFSGAEVKHGPMALIEEGYPLLIFAPRGPAQAGLLALAEEMKNRGARVLLATTDAAAEGPLVLPIQETEAADLDPIAIIQSFYCLAESVARARGLDPDHPRHLAKVTRTH